MSQEERPPNEGVLVALEDEEVVDVFKDLPLVDSDGEDEEEPGSPPPPPPPATPPRGRVVEHIVQVAGEGGLFNCLICGATFKSTQKRYHSLCPEENRPHQCSLCSRKFISKSHLQYHERTHTGETPYKCKQCGKGFKQLSKVKRHEKTHNDVREVCPICKKVMRSQDVLKVHLLTHSEDKIFSCKVCGKKYSRKANLNRHEFRHSEPRYICDKCGKVFVRKHSLIKHIQLHSRKKYNAKELFKCTGCKKAFKTQTQLSRHRTVHEPDVVYECTKCSATLRRKDNMERHMRNLHPGERIPVIEKHFTSKSSTKESSGGPIVDAPPPPAFIPSSSVIKHTSLVVGVMPERVSVIKKLN